MKFRILAPIIVSSFCVAFTALAGNGTVVSSARELAKQGLQDYDAGRYEEAASKLAKAYEVVHVPTLAVNQARALVKLGKWVAASELYLEAQRIPKEKSWQSTQLDAQRDAEKERSELLPRIPRIKIVIKGAAQGEVEVKLDGSSLPGALLDAEQLGDPGDHTVEGTRGSDVVTRSIAAKEGEFVTVTLPFTQSGVAAKPTAGSLPKQQNNAQSAPMGSSMQDVSLGQGKTQPAHAAPAEEGSSQKTIGWISVGVGGAGLVVGGVTGFMAMSKRSSLQDSQQCSTDLKHCTLGVSNDVNTYKSLRTVSTIGFYAGGILAAAGVTLVLTSPKKESAPSVGLWLGPNSAALNGRF